MIESEAGVENGAALAAMDEVTAVLVGPGDLAHSFRTKFWSDEHLAAIEGLFDTGDEQKCPVGIFVSTEDQLADVAGRITFTIYWKDVHIVTDHLEQVIDSNR